MSLAVAGIVLIAIGFLISVAFWIPGLVDRAELREMLGPRYPVVYLVYSANGPGLVLLGALMFVYG